MAVEWRGSYACTCTTTHHAVPHDGDGEVQAVGVLVVHHALALAELGGGAAQGGHAAGLEEGGQAGHAGLRMVGAWQGGHSVLGEEQVGKPCRLGNETLRRSSPQQVHGGVQTTFGQQGLAHTGRRACVVASKLTRGPSMLYYSKPSLLAPAPP